MANGSSLSGLLTSICHCSFVILGRLRGRKKFVQFVEFVASLSGHGFFPNSGMLGSGEIHRKFARMVREFFFKN